MPDNDRLEVEMGVTLKRLTQELARAEKRMVQTANKMEKGFDSSSKRAAASFKNIDAAASRTFSRIAQLAVTGLSVREVQRYADAWTVAGNKIAAASQISGRQARSLSELNDIADETRSGITETADLYAKLLRATKDVAESELEVAKATEIVNKAFKAGGAAASEQAAGILQLAQGLSSGILQGDELRSLRENAPLVAQAIANEFETTIGGLKELGAQGELTAARVFRAILASQGDIESAFSQTNSTIGEGFVSLRNALTEYLGAADQSTGATSKIVSALSGLADNLDAVAIAGGLVLTRFGGAALGSLFASLAVQARAASVAISAAGVATVGFNGALALLGGPVGAVLTGVAALALVIKQLPEAQDELRRSIDNVTLAMGDEIEQINRVLSLQPGANTLTLSAAQAKLQEAQAIYLKLEAQRQEIETMVRASEEYRSLLQSISAYGEILRSIAPAGTDLDDVPLRLREAYSQAEEGLASALERQKALLDVGSATTFEMEATRLEIEKWRDAIDAAKGEFVTLNGEVVTGVDLSERLSLVAGGVNFDRAVSSAQQLASQLGVSVALAQQISNIRAGGPANQVNNNGLDPLDPRNPNNTRPIFEGPTGNVSPFDPSRRPAISAGGGAGGGSGGGSGNQLPGLFEEIEARAEQLRQQIDLIGKTESEVAKLTASTELLAEAKRRGLDLDARQSETGRTLREEIDAQAEAIGRLSEKYETAKEQAEFFESANQTLKDGMLDAIVEGESLSGVLEDLAKKFARAALEASLFGTGAFSGGGGGGGLLGGLLDFGGGGGLLSFDGGGFTGAGGRSGGIDGRGGFPAILHPNETVIDHTKGQSGGGGAEVVIRHEPGMIVEIARGEAVNVTQAGIAQNNRSLEKRQGRPGFNR